MSSKVLLITPPFTQLNTPYPATAYLKGFLNLKDISSYQIDLGIEVINAIFSRKGLAEIFAKIEALETEFSENAQRMVSLCDDYIGSIDGVIRFLQGDNPTLAHSICQAGFLPEASRFSQLQELDWAFGSMGLQDKAKHLATLYLEDVADLVTECVDEDFGFSRYAERLGRSVHSFDELHASLQDEYTYVDKILVSLLGEHVRRVNPQLVIISIPFPGNLYSALRCGQWFNENYPQITVVMGGGFVNTELRSLSDTRIFEYADYLTLDDGESPLEHLIQYVDGDRGINQLRRTFCLIENKVTYINSSKDKDYTQSETGTPDYSDLLLNKYISIIETVNPMHRLWSDGRWNKLTMAHGCYWGKCTFCDISLDYIKVYQPVRAELICDRMEEIIAQTGENGFHFVDEAAPPALMRDLALEILRRKLCVSWWTNIRFEKSFTPELCSLLKTSGCVAVSGGLEVASDRLLGLIKKGVTVAQVARVCQNFTDAGIMVHAYLMYGFPTQTTQETIDSLEMVRQLFDAGIIQSGFWHQFAMTAHSPVGLQPESFNVVKLNDELGTFANNDILHIDETGADHGVFSYGLKKSLFNYMHGINFDLPLQEWFDFNVPGTNVEKNYIRDVLSEDNGFAFIKPDAKIVWLGNIPVIYQDESDDKQYELVFYGKGSEVSLLVSIEEGNWIVDVLNLISVKEKNRYSFKFVKEHYESAGLEDFESFWYNHFFSELKSVGLLVL